MPAEPAAGAAAKRRLGRGLSSLIRTAEPKEAQDAPAPPTEAGSQEIPLDEISPNPHQPRRDFDSAELEELAQSIRQDGILQPLILAPANDDGAERPYVLIAGERRLRAARLAGLATVPCIIRQASDQQIAEWAVIENIQRSNLNPIERANAYRDVMDRFSLTQQQVAERMGQPRATIANYLRLHDLCDELQTMTADGRLTFGHAKVLAGLAGQEDRQRSLARRVVAEGLSVRKLETIINTTPAEPKPKSAPQAKPAFVRDMEQQLTEVVGTRVTILPGRSKNSGRIVVEYYNLDDFDRIAGGLGLSVQT